MKKILGLGLFLTVSFFTETWSSEEKELLFQRYYERASQNHVPSAIQYLDNWIKVVYKKAENHQVNHTDDIRSNSILVGAGLAIENENIKISEGKVHQALLHYYLNLIYSNLLQQKGDHVASHIYSKFAKEFLEEASDQHLEDPSNLKRTLFRWREAFLFQRDPSYLYTTYRLRELKDEALQSQEKALDYLHATRFLPKVQWEQVQPVRQEIFEKHRKDENSYYQAELEGYYHSHPFNHLSSDQLDHLQKKVKTLGYGWSFFEESHFFHATSRNQLMILTQVIELFLRASIPTLSPQENFSRFSSTGTLEQFYFNLGKTYYEEKNEPTHLKRARQCFKNASHLNHSEAQYHLGLMCLEGIGGKKDLILGQNWLEKAAEHGYFLAQFNLGVMCYKGQGTQQSYTEAFKWYYLAAEQGHAEAQFNLGVMCEHGQGIGENYTDAFNWYLMAAEQGDLEAKHNLGILCKKGLGVDQSYPRAFEWFYQAAEQNHAKSQHAIGIMYHKGEGVEQDFEKALEWYQKAADQGDAEAQGTLELIARFAEEYPDA